MGGKGSLAHVCAQLEERLPWYVCDWGKGCRDICSWEKGYPLGMCSWEKGSTHVTGPGLFCVVGGMGAYVVRPSLFSRIKTKTWAVSISFQLLLTKE